MNNALSRITFILILCLGLFAIAARAQTTAFTYQGKLNDVNSTASGTYDFQFSLYDAATGGTQQSVIQTITGVQVTDGAFVVQLDFTSAPFATGADRYLEIHFKSPSDTNYTTLTPRHQITSTPYAIRSLFAETADNATDASNLGGQPASSYVQTSSTDFIRNQTATQTSTNFNLSGTGRANIFDAAAQYNIGGQRVLSIAGSFNLFVGTGAGNSNTTGSNNSFVGYAAGISNSTGNGNSFFGSGAGNNNSVGGSNSFVGAGAGQGNTTGSFNSFFGTQAGFSNMTANNNSFFGYSAGLLNTTGNNNSFVGNSAGRNNTTGSNNSFFGSSAGSSNIGSDNSFFGKSAGNSNTSGFNNSFFGSFAGSSNTTGYSNSFFGRGAGENNTTGGGNSFFGLNAGVSNTTGGGNSFFGSGAGWSNLDGIQNSFFGKSAGYSTTQGHSNSFFGYHTGLKNVTGDGNSFIGAHAGYNNTTGSSNSFFGSAAGYNNAQGYSNSFFGNSAGRSNVAGNAITMVGSNADVGSDNLSFATAVGSNTIVSTSNTIVLGRSAGQDTVRIPGNLFVGFSPSVSNPTVAYQNSLFVKNDGGDTNNFFRLDGAGNNLYIIGSSGAGASAGAGIVFRTGNAGGGEVDRVGIYPDGTVAINVLGAAGGTQLCRNASLIISTCSSSLRYKTDIKPFKSGLNLVNQLQPIAFEWKEGGMKDLGLGAEDVEKVESLLVSYNSKGEVEGVKYDRIGVVILNAVKEQQTQIEIQGRTIKTQETKIEEQNKQITQQQKQIDALIKLVCGQDPRAEICKVGK